MDDLIIGASLGDFKGLTLEKAMVLYLKLSNEFKLNAVEIRFEKESGRPSLWSWETNDELVDFLKNFEVTGAHLPFIYLNPISSNPKIKYVSIKQLKESIRKASKLGMDYAVMHARGFALGLSYEEQFEEWIEVIKELTDCAKENSILLTIENADFLWNLADLAKLVREVDSRWLKITFDIGHAHLRKVPPLQEYPVIELSLRVMDIFLPFFIKKNMPYEDYGSIESFIESEHDLISNIHIHDDNGRKDHLIIGDGKLNFSFISKLKGDFEGAYIFEVEFENYRNQFRKNYERFTELLK